MLIVGRHVERTNGEAIDDRHKKEKEKMKTQLPRLTLLVLAGLVACTADEPSSQFPATVPDGGPSTPDEDTSGPYGGIPVTSSVSIRGLHGPVDVVRDRYGMVHIRATSLEDAERVHAFQMARDRTAQLELVRRAATGRLAEVFGSASPAVVDQDITMRTIGLTRVAKEMFANLSGEMRSVVEAYADGVSQFNERVRSGDEALPADLEGFFGVPREAFEPWTPVDVVAVGRYFALNLSYFANDDIARTSFVEATRAVFNAAASDPKFKKRAGMLSDVVRFAPLDPTTILPSAKTASLSTVPDGSSAFEPSLQALENTSAFRSALDSTRELIGGHQVGVTGSNNWAVGPSRTASGNAMLASDPHLLLGAPSQFWALHIKVEAPNPNDDVDVAGVAFSGMPTVVVGFNENIAWGPTTAIYDATDVYDETLSNDGTGVVFRGNTVPFEKVRETIRIQGQDPFEYDVLVVPHHGPVIPTITADHKVAPPSGKALSVRWSGHKATRDLDSIYGLLRAKNVDDANVALSHFDVGGQHWVAIDREGNMLYTSHSLVPKRDPKALAWDPETFTGTIPCLVQPGDGSAEWGAYLDDDQIPHDKNPARGYIATANNDPNGGTLDNNPANDPVYLSCIYDPGFRAARIGELIEKAGHPITLDDMARIQSDARSAMGATVVPSVLAAIERGLAAEKAPGSYPDVAALVTSERWKNAHVADLAALLEAWRDESNFDAATGVNLDDNSFNVSEKEARASRATALFNVWISRMINLTFEDEFAAAGQDVSKLLGQNPIVERRTSLMYLLTTDKTKLKTYDAAMDDSILFDDMNTPVVESRDERILTSLLDSVAFLNDRLGKDWRWGRLHAIRFAAPVPVWSSLTIPPSNDPVFPDGFPRHGDGLNIDVASWVIPKTLDATADFSPRGGASQRLVVEMDPVKGPIARNALPGGNVWDPTSKHFRDDVELWRKNENHPVPFATADVVEAAESRTVFR